MVQEEIEEKKVVAKEKPLGGTKVVEQTEVQQVKEQPPTAQRGRAEKVAGKSGEVIGWGLKKASRVMGEFTAGISKQMKSGQHHEQGKVQEARQTEYRSEQREQIGEVPGTKVTEKETVEKKVEEETK